MTNNEITFDIKMQDHPILKVNAKNAWPKFCGLFGSRGCCMINQMALGFCGAFGFCSLLGLLTSCNVEFPVTMPAAVATTTKLGREYQGRVRKVCHYYPLPTIFSHF